MRELSVKTSTHRYSVYIDHHLRFHLNDFLNEGYSSILVITDDNIAPLYLDALLQHLPKERTYHTIIPSGEASKNIDMYYRLQTVAMEKGLDRKSLILALGGGVIGDLAGFVAATFMRGIDYVQVPTTILAHDSSVGGKVAINHELGKNMIGNFYPPKAVVYDVDTLVSLPNHEVRSGYAELLKEAYIQDREFLQQLFKTNIKHVDKESLKEHLFKGIQIKANIVEADEKESNVRMFLNFGHTLAHALEASLGYGKITHGEAVAIGMLFALQISEDTYDVSLYSKELYYWLSNNDYPLQLQDIDIDQIIQLMQSDKKSQFQTINMVLLKDVGQPVIEQMDEAKLREHLQFFLKGLNKE